MITLVVGIVIAVLLVPIGLTHAQRTEPNIAANGNVYMELDFDFEKGNLLPRADTMEIYFRTKNISSLELIPETDRGVYVGFNDTHEPYFYFDNDAKITLDDGRVLVKKVALYVAIQERQLSQYSQDFTAYWGYGILDIEGNQWPVEGMLEVRDRALAYLTVISSKSNIDIDMVYDPIPTNDGWRRLLGHQPAPQPLLFDMNEMDITDIPYPHTNQIMIEIIAYASEHYNTPSWPSPRWTGSLLYGDGDIVSFDGNREDSILVDCEVGQPYSMSFQKVRSFGSLNVTVYNHERILDFGRTDANYGVVRLVGTC